MTIRTLLVDDEALAIAGLRRRLEAFPDVEIVGEAMNGREAIRAIRTEKPDLVFLDIQMPSFDGFSVVSALSDITPPMVIFVTAYSDHAIRAFEAEAVDYLMKPVEQERLSQSLERVRARLAERRLCEEAERLAARLAQVDPDSVARLDLPAEPGADRFERVINVKDQGQIFRVEVDSIEKIDAAGDYMCLTTSDGTLVLRETMKDLERRLDPRKFQRVHRSTIVNLDAVKQVKPHTNGECFLTLASGASVKVSRSYREVVARFL
jgi:two-component system LytT family response regulator